MIWLAIAVLTVVLLGQTMAIYQLAKQHGRLLLRIDGLERPAHPTVPPSASQSKDPHPNHAPLGLPAGSMMSAFSLPDLTGRTVQLPDFRGKRVLAIHWSPSCGFCDLIAPELAAIQDKLSTPALQALLISYGDADVNRATAQRQRLTMPILLLGDHRLAAFDQLGTPVAYLLDTAGRVSKPVAVGADAVLALVRDAAGSNKRLPGEKPLSQSLLIRDGLKSGTPAPRFTLPDLMGRPISLDAYRGRKLLLVFSDPGCGPCNELAPSLADIDRAHRDNGLAVVLVGRGDREENRRKAMEYGLPFPVVVQEQWKLSKEYGIFTTPVGFLIGPDGIIERPVAKGRDEILTLARQAGERVKEPVG